MHYITHSASLEANYKAIMLNSCLTDSKILRLSNIHSWKEEFSGELYVVCGEEDLSSDPRDFLLFIHNYLPPGTKVHMVPATDADIYYLNMVAIVGNENLDCDIVMYEPTESPSSQLTEQSIDPLNVSSSEKSNPEEIEPSPLDDPEPDHEEENVNSPVALATQTSESAKKKKWFWRK